jgi:peptidoglycan/LPS O-acetylase OafA/YrhL
MEGQVGDQPGVEAAKPAPTRRGGRIPALDGIRAFGVITVAVFHLFVFAAHPPGWVPVGAFLCLDMFFVLSGFLITSILIDERDRRGSFSLRNFYRRRALRLLPALVAMLAFAGAVAAIWRSQIFSRATLEAIPWVLFYAGNWRIVFNSSPLELGAINQTWSLAVEEQFYILWPILLLLILRLFSNRMRIAVGLFVLALCDMIYRYLSITQLHTPLAYVYVRSDTHFDGIIMGCSLAFYVAASREGSPKSPRFHQVVSVVTVVCVAALIVMVMRENKLTASGQWFGIPTAVICTSVMVFNLVTQPVRALAWALELRPLVWIGKRSYGIYLWQYTIEISVGGIRHSAIGTYEWDMLLLLAGFGAGALSYKYLESPFLRRKVPLEHGELPRV